MRNGEPNYEISPGQLEKYGITDLSPFVMALGRTRRYARYSPEANKEAAYPFFDRKIFFHNPFAIWFSVRRTKQILREQGGP